ncbi:MAG: AmmeMemoRadiSam system protein A, partial [Gallicola sp.]|nr:AmmeMemoRadiSam system protein A [Gallicola sp.]
MGKITGAAISPHPPIILPIVGGGREREASTTITGMKKMAKEAARKKPDTIIVITPHGTVFRDAHSIVMEKELSGDFTSFG